MIRDDLIRKLMEEGAEEVVVRTDTANFHYLHNGRSIIQVDKESGIILSEFPMTV